MNKITLTFFLLIISVCFLGQISDSIFQTEIIKINELLNGQSENLNSLNTKLNFHKSTNFRQQSSIDLLNNQNKEFKYLVDSLTNVINSNRENIIINSEELGYKIKEVGENADDKIMSLDNHLEENRIYWIIGSLITVLIISLVYLILRKTIKTSKSNVEEKIINTKNALEEESLKLDKKLVDLLGTQLKISQEENKNLSSSKSDHSLALKVADEIVRMQKNISRMDQGTKGLKPLIKGLDRIQNNFASNGYEMVNLLNKPYEDRMNVDVINFIEDDDFEKGIKLITKIIKPQVNFNNKLIQRAQVEVTQN
tara:strand:+ start:43 stop:975 length:933 start_codon:yes stop_codon:yes gene_type:complete